MSDLPAEYPALPEKSAVRVHEASPNRLVLDVPPGKNSGGLGFFAVIWNGFMAFCTSIFLFARNQANKPEGDVVFFLFISVFWLVGLGLIYAWLKLRFERCFLLVEQDRAVLRKMFLGRQKQTEILLDDTAQCLLTEAYQQNDVPVYRVTLTGLGGNPIHFGTALTEPEKNWCVDAINVLVRPQAEPVSQKKVVAEQQICDACGDEIPISAFRTTDGLLICPACGHEQRDVLEKLFDNNTIDAESLPAELPGIVTILEDSPERLGLQLSVTEYAAVRWVVALFTLFFAMIWYGFLIGGDLINLGRFFQNGPQPGVMNWLSLLFSIPFILAGVMPMSVFFLVLWGKLTTWIDREQIRIRLHVGPFGKTWKVNQEDVTEIRLMDSSEMQSAEHNPRVKSNNPRVKGSFEISKAAGIVAGTRRLAMTAMHQPLTARFVVRKVRDWLSHYVPEKHLL